MSITKKYDMFVNEGVRDKMTPKSEEEIIKAIDKYFTSARKDGNVDIEAGFYYEVWEPFAERYNIFDNFYAFNGIIYFLYLSTDEYENMNKLSCTYDSVEKFKKRLEDALIKINSL